MSEPVSYYALLNVSPQASDAEIKLAYRRLAMKLHPDRNMSRRALAEAQIRMINEAYEALKTRERREAYNRKMKMLYGRSVFKTSPLSHARPPAGNDNRIARHASWLSQVAGFFTSSGKSGASESR